MAVGQGVDRHDGFHPKRCGRCGEPLSLRKVDQLEGRVKEDALFQKPIWLQAKEQQANTNKGSSMMVGFILVIIGRNPMPPEANGPVKSTFLVSLGFVG